MLSEIKEKLNVDMHVIHIITTIEIGGAENQLLLLAEEQIQLGLKVLIVPLKGKNSLNLDFSKIGANVDLTFTNKNFLYQILKFKLLIKKFSPLNTIIHAHLPQAELVSRFATSREYSRIVTRHFGGKFYPKSMKCISSWLGRIASGNSSQVVAISNSVAKMLALNNEIHNIKLITRIYYGFSERRFKNFNFTFDSNMDRPQIIIGTIARLSKEKDLETLIISFSKFKSIYPDSTLRIIGEGPEKINLEKKAAEVGVAKSIEWLGKQKDVYYWLKTFDIFVLTSKFEGFGMVLLEAMFAEKRIVCAKNSAIEEIINDSHAGVFFETSNTEDLVLKLVECINMDFTEFREDQNKVLSNFTVKKSALAHKNLYLGILNKQ